MRIRVGNTWKHGESWVKVGSSWKKALATWVKVGNVWKVMYYKFKHITTSKQVVQHDTTALSDERWYQLSRDVTCTPSNYPMDSIEFFARYKYQARDTYLRLGITDDDERDRFIAAWKAGKATVKMHGPFVLTLTKDLSNINTLSGGRVNLQPNNDDLIYNLLRSWEGKDIYIEINIDD